MKAEDREKSSTFFNILLGLHNKMPDAPIHKIVTVAMDEARYLYSGVAHGANPSNKTITDKAAYHRQWRKTRKERAV